MVLEDMEFRSLKLEIREALGVSFGGNVFGYHKRACD